MFHGVEIEMGRQNIRTACAFMGLLAGCMGLSALDGWSMGSRVPVVGTTAVDFQLVDLNGHPQHLNDYRGKVVLLNFWATWCKPCTTEMPAMQKAYDRLREKGFVVLAIKELEDDEEVHKHINQYGHTFPVADGPRQ
jgi:thiol-disulfide isomerase/thioredoxin